MAGKDTYVSEEIPGSCEQDEVGLAKDEVRPDLKHTLSQDNDKQDSPASLERLYGGESAIDLCCVVEDLKSDAEIDEAVRCFRCDVSKEVKKYKMDWGKYERWLMAQIDAIVKEEKWEKEFRDAAMKAKLSWESLKSSEI